MHSFDKNVKLEWINIKKEKENAERWIIVEIIHRILFTRLQIYIFTVILNQKEKRNFALSYLNNTCLKSPLRYIILNIRVSASITKFKQSTDKWYIYALKRGRPQKKPLFSHKQTHNIISIPSYKHKRILLHEISEIKFK